MDCLEITHDAAVEVVSDVAKVFQVTTESEKAFEDVQPTGKVTEMFAAEILVDEMRPQWSSTFLPTKIFPDYMDKVSFKIA